jgi:LytS/YehU family sensor histidine kinase
MVERDPARSKKMIGLLANVLSESFRRDRSEAVTLEAEAAYTELFLRLEQALLPANLNFAIDVEGDALAALVPPFILQSLIRAVTEYPIATSRPTVEIQIEVMIVSAQLCLRITETSSEDVAWATSPHHLQELHARLRLYCGNDAMVHSNGTGKVRRVEVLIPFRLE